jgi:non-ribosomal peptide synthetase component E (peptide arylation enzyme)
VILGHRNRPAGQSFAGDTTLDDLFRRAAARQPDRIALADPPNRASFSDGVPRQLTYAQADGAISAIAATLNGSNLRADAIVALQVANTVESVLAILAVLRAGLIAMPLPLLWRRADVVNALRRGGASALIVSGRIGSANHFDLAINAAAEVFGVRHVFGFGSDPPDGMIPLDQPLSAVGTGPGPTDGLNPSGGRSAHLAAVTWDVSADGALQVARSHAELVAGGLAVLLEGRFGEDAVILTTLPAGSFGSLAAALLPWLIVGGTLALHHPFDEAVFAAQCRNMDVATAIVPGPLVASLAQAGHLSRLASVVALWRAPERLQRAPAWHVPQTRLVDVQIFGEIGLIATARQPDGRTAPIRFGPILAPRGVDGALEVAQVERTAGGMLALRGPMVPGAAFPPGSEFASVPCFKAAGDGFVDTGYSCRESCDGATVELTGSPPGIVGCGGYRFAVRELAAMIRRVDPAGTLVALPDALAGHRLAGSARDRSALAVALRGIGANPLVVAAFGGDLRQRTDDGGRTIG